MKYSCQIYGKHIAPLELEFTFSLQPGIYIKHIRHTKHICFPNLQKTFDRCAKLWYYTFIIVKPQAPQYRASGFSDSPHTPATEKRRAEDRASGFSDSPHALAIEKRRAEDRAERISGQPMSHQPLKKR